MKSTRHGGREEETTPSNSSFTAPISASASAETNATHTESHAERETHYGEGVAEGRSRCGAERSHSSQSRSGAPAPSLVHAETSAHPPQPDVDCASSVVELMCAECGYVHPVDISCNRRTCPYCANKRFLRLKEEYNHLNDRVKNGLILELGLRFGPHVGGSRDVGWMVARLIDAFKKLRRRKVFREVRGGFYSIHVKPKEGGFWNVHLHAILDGPYLPQGKLSREWGDITGDSFVVDIQGLRNREAGVVYVLGYCSSRDKVREMWEGISEARKREFEEAVKHRRLIQTFGHLHGVQKREWLFECPECGCTDWINLTYDYAEGQSLADWNRGRKPPPQPSY